jgi:hypothetical protein
MNETAKKKSGWRIVRRILVGIAVLATLIALLYAEEDWRGKRAWENCKRELEAKGAVLDWNAYIPPPVPDDQNFFKAPNMADWFVRGAKTMTNELFEQLTAESLSRFTTNNPVVLAEWTWQPLLTAKNIAAADTKNADLVLKYTSFPSRPHIFTEANVPVVSDENPDTNAPVAVIQFQDVPITAAIENLAHQAGINYLLDPKIGYNQPDKNGQIKSEPTLSIRWKNITARAALLALLDNFDLQLVENPNDGLARITLKNSDTPQIYASPDLDGKITRLIQNVIGTFGTNMIIGVRGDRLLAKSPAEIKPARIILLSGMEPGPEIGAWFTQCFPTNATGGGSPRIHIEPPIGTIPVPKTFRVILDSAYSAADYLAWSDQFEPAFDEIREALKRPYAIIPGDYSVPYLMPIPNFVTIRALAQTLAQRAQCDFLLGKPDDALRELTLIHDMCRILEKPPTGKPETLVEAIINVAISGLYVSTIGDGFKLKAWSEPQIAILQKQLKETELVPFVVAGLEFEQVSSSHTLEKTPASKIGELFNTVIVSSTSEKNKPGIWKKITNPMYLYFKFCPRGWIYQNMVNSVSLVELGYKDGVDLKQDTISPSFFNKATRDLEKSLNHRTPFNVWAQIAIPNFTKAWQNTAYNQTLVNEAQIACALERYHLAHGEYPETLDALAPQFISLVPHDIINGQPLHYRRTDDGKFLLYSVGWNETDDGGQEISTQTKGGSIDYTKGDWVWKN